MPVAATCQGYPMISRTKMTAGFGAIALEIAPKTRTRGLNRATILRGFVPSGEANSKFNLTREVTPKSSRR
jgi:hypothetical protein